MASSKQNFLGLVKIEGIQTSAYNSLEKAGKLIFAHLWDSQSGNVKVNEKFIINANGVEYNIATADIFESLEARVVALEAWKLDVDSSIDRLDSSVSALEALLADYSEWKVSVDASIDVLQAKDVEIDASISDISSRLSGSLKSAEIASAVAVDNSTLITLTTTNNADTEVSTAVKVEGSNYVKVEGTANNVTLSVTTASVATAGVGEGLADAKDVKDYVDGVISDLEQALKFISDVTSTTATQLLTTDAREAGDTFVASGDAFDYEGKHVEAGDLVIVKTDSAAGVASDIIVVERNLDGAVTAGAALDSSHLVVGTGAQGVKTINVTAEGLETAIANANSAIQGVDGTTPSDYVTITTSKDGDTSVVTVTVDIDVIDVSTATTVNEGLADAKQVKDYVDWKVDSIPEVEMTLDSSTPAYVSTSATVSNGVINASVGVKTATLADASNNIDGLATAVDVYTELTKVEEVMATSVTTMADTLGMNASLGVDWSDPTWSTYSYKEAIEEVAEQAKQSGVTSFGNKKGAISIDTTNATDGSVAFAMDGSTLKGTVVGWDALVARVADVSQQTIDNDASIADLSTNVIPALENRIADVSQHAINNDASIADLSTKLADFTVKSIEGEAGISARANDEFVAVSASEPDANGKVSLDASVQLAEDVTLPTGATHETATGLATDGWVKDFLAWEVIGD